MSLVPLFVTYATPEGLQRWLRNTTGSGQGGGGVPATAPGAPSSVVASAPTAIAITLSWGPPASDGGSPVTGYAVTIGGGTPTVLGATASSFVFSNLAASTTYTVTVAAINAAGTGSATSKSVKTASAATAGARFPGDPQPKVNGGRLYWGASMTGGGSPAPLETPGQPIGIRHRYWKATDWLTALIVPTAPAAPASGSMAAAVVEDHAAGRIPCVSWNTPGSNWASSAAGTRDYLIDPWIAWCATRTRPIWWIVNHEPENDGYAAPDYVAWMKHIRSRIAAWEQANGGKHPTLVFVGAFIAATFGPHPLPGGPAAWYPGDGVFDVLGVDPYAWNNTDTTLLGPNWLGCVSFADAHKIPLAATEWGATYDNPKQAAIMQEFFDFATSGLHDIVALQYFNSLPQWLLNNNTGSLSKFVAISKDPKVVVLADLGL